MGSIKFQPPLKHNRIQRFLFFMGGLSTMIIIALIVWKRSLSLSSPDDEHEGNTQQLRQSDAKLEFLQKHSTKSKSKCNWKPEPLMGTCDVTEPTETSQKYKTAASCEHACCESESCITFQFRPKEGCLHGGDTRLGAEKDGPGEWCEPRPPAMWHGQRLTRKQINVPGACDDATWDPTELRGQCFGLGSKRHTEENTAEACRNLCCSENNKDADATELGCGSWQWREDAGCFYSTEEAGSCQPADPEAFEMFVGKRKAVEGRTYAPYAYSDDFADMAEIYGTK
jgi:hypothetical protein